MLIASLLDDFGLQQLDCTNQALVNFAVEAVKSDNAQANQAGIYLLCVLYKNTNYSEVVIRLLKLSNIRDNQIRGIEEEFNKIPKELIIKPPVRRVKTAPALEDEGAAPE